MADKAKRDGGAERVAEAAGHKTSAVDRARLPSADARLNARELRASTPPSTTLPTPGLCGQLSPRLARVSAACCAPHAPVSTACPASTRSPHMPAWSTAAKPRGAHGGAPPVNQSAPRPARGPGPAAPRCSRNHPPGQQLVARWEKTPGQGNARSLRRRPGAGRSTVCSSVRWLARWRGASPPPAPRGQPGASRDAAGMRRERVGATPAPAASGNATARLGPGALSPRHGWDPRAASCKAGARRRRWPGLPRPRARHARASPRGSARLLRRTGGGHDILSRAQRIPARRRGPRPGRDAGRASRARVPPRGLAPADSTHVRTPDRLTTAPAFTRRAKICKHRSQGPFVA